MVKIWTKDELKCSSIKPIFLIIFCFLFADKERFIHVSVVCVVQCLFPVKIWFSKKKLTLEQIYRDSRLQYRICVLDHSGDEVTQVTSLPFLVRCSFTILTYHYWASWGVFRPNIKKIYMIQRFKFSKKIFSSTKKKTLIKKNDILYRNCNSHRPWVKGWFKQ